MQAKAIWIIGGTVLAAIVVTLGLAIPLSKGGDDDGNQNVPFIGQMVLDEVPLIDGHNDFPMNLYLLEKNQLANFEFDSDLKSHPVWGNTRNSHTDLPRLREGKVGGQFWAAYVSCAATQNKDAVEQTLGQIDIIKRFTEKYSNDFKFTTTADGIWDAFNEGKIASMIGIEGGHSIDSRLSVLRLYHELGVRYMTLTHSCNQPWIDASPIDNDVSAPKLNVSDWGKSVIKEMNRLGMLVDLSHVSYGVMHSVLDISEAPVIFSHSSSHAIYAHHRNAQDDILWKLKVNNGIIMVNFYVGFIGGNSIDDVIKHLNYIKDLIGPDHVGLGGDYDGIESTPQGLDDVSMYPNLFNRLAEAGHGYEPWTPEELRKLAGLNLIRVFKDAEKTSADMKARGETPYEDLIPDIDLYNSGDQTCRSDFKYSPAEDFVRLIADAPITRGCE